MCSDGRMIWTPTDVKLGNLICLEVSSLMAWHSFLGSAGSEVLSHSRCWIMVVSNCWKTIRPEGPVRSVHSQLGKQGFPLTRPRLYFFMDGKEVIRRWMCMQQRVKLYFPDVFIYTSPGEGFERVTLFGKKHYLTCEHTCVERTWLPTTCICLCMCVHFSACLCIFLWQCHGCWSPFPGGWLWTQKVSR